MNLLQGSIAAMVKLINAMDEKKDKADKAPIRIRPPRKNMPYDEEAVRKMAKMLDRSIRVCPSESETFDLLMDIAKIYKETFPESGILDHPRTEAGERMRRSRAKEEKDDEYRPERPSRSRALERRRDRMRTSEGKPADASRHSEDKPDATDFEESRLTGSRHESPTLIESRHEKPRREEPKLIESRHEVPSDKKVEKPEKKESEAISSLYDSLGEMTTPSGGHRPEEKKSGDASHDKKPKDKKPDDKSTSEGRKSDKDPDKDRRS